VILGRFTRRRQRGAEPAADRVLSLERELQGLRLTLAERNHSLQRLRSDLTRERGSAQDHVDEVARADVQRLLGAIATPVVQLVTLSHLDQAGPTELRAKDVLDVAMHLVRALNQEGLATFGAIGDTEKFDPDRHDPLSTATPPQPGQPVTVRFVGLSHQGRILRRAGVES
jgi:molecular chaperone GrpE (heat shock protein)